MDLRGSLQKTLGDGYTLERELEGGGMARVFVARDESLGRKVVVKTLADDSGVSVSAERFRREIRLAASLQQANIVPVHSAGDVDGVPYYTMPFVEGESLRAHMDKRGALDVREAVNILRDVARALAFAHERGVVHRDIKPENILLSGSTAVVTDFGIAKAIEASHSQAGATLTQLGTLLGTPAYISPEQAAGDPKVDHLADIYSLGVVAYEMLAGARPFTATAARALLAAHVNEQPPQLAAKREGLPRRLTSLVMRCLEKDPERRPQKAVELLEELDDALHAPHVDVSQRPVIAALPLANMSASADDEYFADGMTEDIIAQLSQIASITVIARTSVMRFKGGSRRPREIGADLGATHVVEGSVRRAGSRLRVVTKLVEARTEASLWTETFDRDMADVFAVQGEVAELVANALRARLTPSERNRIAKPPTTNLAAYEEFLLGRQAFHVPPAEKVVYATAAAHFERAIAIDGSFAKSYAALANIHVFWAQGYWGTRPRDAWPRAKALAEHALVLDPNSGEAHAVLGAYATTFQFDWAAALRHCARAVELDAGNATVHSAQAYLLAICGRTDDALAAARRAYAIDPLSPSVRFEPSVLWLARRFDESLAAFEALERIVPDTFFVTVWRALVLVALEQHADALALLRERADTFADNWSRLTTAALLAACGDSAGARSRLERLHEMEKTEYVWPVGFAMAYAHLNDHDRAFRYLEQAYEDRTGWITHLPTGSFVDPLRGDPRLDALIRKVGAPVEQTAYRPPVRTSTKPSVAVLPLANMSASADDEYFADGMTEDIIAQLSQIASLKVISRTSVMGYKKSTKKAREIAAELGATHLVEGSVRRAANRLRIVAKLIDAERDGQLWSETFDRELTDVFAVQSEVSLAIVDALDSTLTPRERARLLVNAPANAEAYDAYLLGMHHWYKFTVEGVTKAGEYFRKALALDEDFAPAHAGLANYHLMVGGAPLNLVPAAVAIPAARKAAERALAINPLSGPACEALALAQCWFEYDWSGAKTTAARGVEVDPNSALAWSAMAHAHDVTGSREEAMRAARRSVELDPQAALILHVAAAVHSHARCPDEADAYRRRLDELYPGIPLAASVAGELLLSRGRNEEALALLTPHRDALRHYDLFTAHYAFALGRCGHRDEALALARELEAQCREGRAAWADVALAHLGVGDVDRALNYIERVPDQRPAGGLLNSQIGVSPLFDQIRNLPRFQDVLTRMQLGKQIPTARPGGTADRRSVAVLPFANLSPDPENEFFADGITDDLIAQVAKIGALRVIARTSVMRYRGVQDAARTAAKELGVGAVVEGTVRRAGKRARIVAQLIDASSDAPIWSETYDRDLDDMFTVQTEVATNVAAALKVKLTPAEERRIARAPTRDAKAYDLYLVGRHLFNRRTPESLRSAIDHFEQAIERDAGFAAAHAGLADAHVFAGLGYAPVSILEAFASAKLAADRAIALDESSPEAQCAMGLSAMHGDWDVVRAREAFERAIQLNPSHAAAHQMLGWCTFGGGEYAAALEPLGRARELDPLNVSLVVEQAWPYMYGGLHEIGLELCRRAVTLDPGFGLGHYNVGNCLEALGRHTEALASFERAVECMGPSPWMLASIGSVSVALGNPTRAKDVLATLDEQGRAGVAVWLSIAIVRDALGEPELALNGLERSIETHEPFVWALGLENWLKFPNARKLPGFNRLYARVGGKPHDIPRQRELLLAHAKQQGLA